MKEKNEVPERNSALEDKLTVAEVDSDLAQDGDKVKYHKALNDYRISVEKMRDMSINLFEKQLVYVAGGSLVGSAYIIDRFLKGVQVDFNWVLLSWFLWGLAIVINMLSHNRAMVLYNRTLGDIVEDNYDVERANSRAKEVGCINYVTIGCYFIGVVFFMIFVWINRSEFNRQISKDGSAIELLDHYSGSVKNKMDSLMFKIHSLEVEFLESKKL